MFKKLIILSVFISPIIFGANDGKITNMGFSGENSVWGAEHSDIVQISLENEFSAPGCHINFAAVKKSDTHMISALLSAYMADRAITVQLSNKNTYYDGTRCFITDLFVHKK
ncbi:hypothetical protein AAOGI_40280 [Agarivorans albus]